MSDPGIKINRDELLKAISKLKLRVEKQPDDVNNLENFVPPIDFSSVASSNSHIIYGRNGTGKTHLLKAFHQYAEENYEKEKVIPVFIDLKNLEIGPVLPNIPLHELIIRFYRLFIGRIIHHLNDFSEKTITINLLQKFFGGSARQRKDKISKSIKEIYSILNLEKIDELVDEYVRKVQIDKEGTDKVSAKAGVSAELSKSKADLKLGAELNVSAEEMEKNKENIHYIYKGLALIDYASIREELENIIDQCGAKSIILLIDEWSDVSMSIQPLLAEMIKKTIGSSNKIFLKIGALKFFTRTSSISNHPQRIGFSHGVDISQLIDLDNFLNYDINNEVVKDFLTIIVYKHICSAYYECSGVSIKSFENYICKEIFQYPRVYFEVVRASEGNPRDFLRIFSSSAALIMYDKSKKISIKDAAKIAIDHFTDTKTPELKNNRKANDLYNKIFDLTVRNKTKVFSVSKQKGENNALLHELLNYRFIHLLNPSIPIIGEDYSTEYILYSMDYGKLLSLKVHKAGEKVLDLALKSVEMAAGLTIANDHMKQTLRWILKEHLVKGKLKKLTGAYFVSRDKIENADMSNIESLISKCSIDKFL